MDGWVGGNGGGDVVVIVLRGLYMYMSKRFLNILYNINIITKAKQMHEPC